MWSRIAYCPSLSPWYATPQGAFALERETQLLQHVLSPWPRRGHSLLEVGCGDGHFLEFFWQAGFDVTAVDRASPLLEAARQRLHGRADIQAAAADALPFADNTFDYVALTAPLPTLPPAPVPGAHAAPAQAPILARDILDEALRVAAKGLLLRCWNPFSLAGLWRYAWLCSGPTPSVEAPVAEDDADAPCPDAQEADSASARRALWMGWRDYRALLRSLAPGCAISTRSTLLGPPPTWHHSKALRLLNTWECPLPLGAVVYLRVDHQTRFPLTSLPLRLSSLRMKNPRPATAMERGQDADHSKRRSSS